MTAGPTDARTRSVQWRATGNGEFPYEADIESRRWTIRINDFPAEPMYTLLVDGAEVETFDGWPPAWTRPT